MKGQTIVRAVEIEVRCPTAAHLGRQPEIQLEEKLDPHLAEPRDTDPDGARNFFIKSIMQTLVVKQLDE